MARNETRSLFDDPAVEVAAAALHAPLAERMRPRNLDEFVGQADVIGENSLLGTVLRRSGKLSSLILWGPPGTGKTTLARLIAERNGAIFIALSAVLAGVREVRAAIDEARKSQRRNARTILFIDEIHRFNKAQQDALLGAVEDGTITLDRGHHREPVVRGQRRLALAVPGSRFATAGSGRCRNDHPPRPGRPRARAGGAAIRAWRPT